MTEVEKLKKVVTDLIAACNSMLDEVVDRKATDWGLVNGAMAAGEEYLNKLKL